MFLWLIATRFVNTIDYTYTLICYRNVPADI